MSKCNVLFIVPPNLPLHNLLKHAVAHVHKGKKGENDDPGANMGTTRSMPMGVLSIAGYVAKHTDVNFEVLDLNLEVVELLGSGGTLDWDKFLNYHLKERYNSYKHSIGLEFKLLGFSFYSYPTAVTYEYHFPVSDPWNTVGKQYLRILFDFN